MNKPLIIGMNPTIKHRPDAPLFPLPEKSTGGRLFALSPFENKADYIRNTCRINLVGYQFGGKWPQSRARQLALNLKGSGLMHDRVVVLLGRQVKQAFGLDKIDNCRLYDYGRGTKIGCIPHPSGLNRWYNEEENRAAVEQFLRRVLT